MIIRDWKPVAIWSTYYLVWIIFITVPSLADLEPLAIILTILYVPLVVLSYRLLVQQFNDAYISGSFRTGLKRHIIAFLLLMSVVPIVNLFSTMLIWGMFGYHLVDGLDMEQRIIINGRALNAKLGAIVQTDSKHVVYVAGLDDWDDTVLGELIRVTGIPIRPKLAADPQVDEIGGISSGIYGDSDVLEGATWTMIDSIALGLPVQVGEWLLNSNPNHIELTERVSGGHIVAEYNYLQDLEQPAKLVLLSYASSQDATEAMVTLAGELDSNYLTQQIKAIGIESLAWTRPEPKFTASGSGYYLMFDKRVGDEDEKAVGAMWVSQNAVWRLAIESMGPGDERSASSSCYQTDLEELVNQMMAAVSSGRPPQLSSGPV